jgi:hypothetical protein
LSQRTLPQVRGRALFILKTEKERIAVRMVKGGDLFLAEGYHIVDERQWIGHAIGEIEF